MVGEQDRTGLHGGCTGQGLRVVMTVTESHQTLPLLQLKHIFIFKVTAILSSRCMSCLLAFAVRAWEWESEGRCNLLGAQRWLSMLMLSNGAELKVLEAHNVNWQSSKKAAAQSTCCESSCAVDHVHERLGNLMLHRS